MTSPDFLVLGLGPAGCAAAVFAAQAGASVVLAGLAPKGLRFGEYLPPEANPLLRELQVTPSALSCSGVRSWWNGAESVQESLFHPLGEARFVNRPDFEVALLHKARELGVRILEGAHLQERSGKRVALSGGEAFTPRTLIDATGRPAAVARQFGVGRQRVDRLTAVGARIASSHPDRSLLIEAVGAGWWYTCPLPGGKRSVVFLTDSDLPQFDKARTAGGWREFMGPRIEEIVG
ncbi:MAG: hypothetical protein KC800_16640, partial [Candidatus Eremiobacteraeota bacterium]|nr:hypothetical protein [Candidatus Eremiobacteraeota bacterium]